MSLLSYIGPHVGPTTDWSFALLTLVSMLILLVVTLVIAAGPVWVLVEWLARGAKEAGRALVTVVTLWALVLLAIGTTVLAVQQGSIESTLFLAGAIASLTIVGFAMLTPGRADESPFGGRHGHATLLGVVSHLGVALLFAWMAITWKSGVPWGSIGKATAGWVMALLLLGACGRLQVWRPSPVAASAERK